MMKSYVPMMARRKCSLLAVSCCLNIFFVLVYLTPSSSDTSGTGSLRRSFNNTSHGGREASSSFPADASLRSPGLTDRNPNLTELKMSPDDRPREVRFYLYRDVPSYVSTDLISELVYNTERSRGWNFVQHSIEWLFYHQLSKLPRSGWVIGSGTNEMTITETTDKDAADFFVYPLFWKILARHSEVWKRAGLPSWSVKGVANLIRNETYFTRCHGCDHVIAFSEGNAKNHHETEVIKVAKQTISLVVDQPWLDADNNIEIPYPCPPYMYDPLWRAERSLPPYMDDEFGPVVRDENAWVETEMAHATKKFFVYYRGANNSDVRVTLVNHFASARSHHHHYLNLRHEDAQQLIVITSDTLSSQDEYLRELADSVFCLVPRGKTPASQRFEQAVLVGCIPVVMADDFVAPFDDENKGPDSSFWIRAPEDAAQLIPFLTAITGQTIRSKQRLLALQWPRFSYSFPPRRNGALAQIVKRIVKKVDSRPNAMGTKRRKDEEKKGTRERKAKTNERKARESDRQAQTGDQKARESAGGRYSRMSMNS